MSTWMKGVIAGLKRVTPGQVEGVAPEYEGCEHYHPVGVISGDLQKLHYRSLEHKSKAREAAAAVLLLNGRAA